MGGVPLPRIPNSDGRIAARAVGVGNADRTSTALAVRWILQELSRLAPGKSVEVRVPPFGAVQIVDGPGHTRGTPPNVIELDAATLVSLASGTESWESAVARGAVIASGTRATIAEWIPLEGLSE